MSLIPTINTLVSPFRRLLGLAPPPLQDTSMSVSTCEQVFQARALLKSLGLPTELVLVILDYAEYWPFYEYSGDIPRELKATARPGIACAANICFETAIFNNPVYEDIVKSGERCTIKRVEFDVVSRDQGWTSENTEGTFATTSWTEVSIMRDTTGQADRSPPLNTARARIHRPEDYHEWLIERGTGWELVQRPESASMGAQGGEGPFAWYLQGNRVAADNTEYHIVWTEHESQGNEGSGTGEGFLRALRAGDRILMWARAKYPGWQCHVDHVRITVRYGF
ncbi:hypothetical protein NX059_003319 [Plenodomus lindquistii]|nr:hypothetical protein NX059_003319 [Plenodomus lindquistii]